MANSLLNSLVLLLISTLSIPTSLHAEQLLSPEELKSWIDSGYIDDSGRPVVILDTGLERAIYDAGHVPGAHYVPMWLLYGGYGSGFRTDGVIETQFLVPHGPLMDSSIVQDYGIEMGTRVVFTGNAVWNTTRGYWLFRYWGFSKDQLSILNGEANGPASVWEDAGYELETSEPPPPVPSTFSVSSFPGNMDAVRAPTEQFFSVSEGAIPNTIVIDSRTESDWNAVIPVPGWNDTHVFAFRVHNSTWIMQDEFFVETSSGAHVFKSEQEILSLLRSRGVTDSMVPYSFCMGGGWATVSFFVFDALLERSAKIHDGSTYELGQLGYVAGPGGTYVGLPEDSQWRFDQDRYCSIINHNDPLLAQQPTIVDAYAPSARLVNEEDKGYHVLFADGFESGDTSAWSVTMP